MQPHTTNWTVVGLSIAAGIVAALQIGKVPPAIPALQQELNLSLVQVGWLASIFNVIGAVGGLLIGGLADRFNYRRALIVSTLFLLCGSLAGAFSPSPSILFLSRVCESFGLVGAAVSAPRLITAYTQTADRSLALGAWSIYIPTGFAIGMVLGSFMVPWTGWRGLWLFNTIILAAYLLVFILATKPTALTQQSPSASPWLANVRAVIRTPGLWLLAGIFACYTVQWFALTTWMPTFMSETMHYSIPSAALLGALIVLVNVTGNLSGAWFLHHGIGRWWLIAASLVVMTVCGYGIFASDTAPIWKIVQAMIFSAVGGLLPAALLSAIAVHVPSPGQVGTANGFIVQGSHIGIVAGAPLFAWIVSWVGTWEDTWWLMAVMGTAGLALTLILRHIEIGLLRNRVVLKG
ncbi:MAG: MFS transporter [Arenicellales bacterium]|nr:MFS transporter [Arenicellales bacterium]